jgi:hypothetical protein
MARQIIVLGTNHALQGADQVPTGKKIDDPTYEVLVRKLIDYFCLDYIFEEVSGCGPTTASKLEKPGLGYWDVDPPKSERPRYGIEPGLPFEGFCIYEVNDPRMPSPEPLATQKKLETEIGREKLWVERINEKRFENGLMICGVAHTFSVAARLKKSGFSVTVLVYTGPN